MGIGLLGPLEIDGETAALAPRDRVVLEALSLRPGSVVSPETLADALWGPEHRPASWQKVVQGCVVRLRKRLGPDRIETLPTGYRLAITKDELDHERFERFVLRAQELLAFEEHDRAAYLVGEALALWRGEPLVDLLEWDVGRIEVERLQELRRDAEDLRVEAGLRAGHHTEMLGEARRLVAEAPLRESRWAKLALAQYQAGQQAEALRTLRQARTVLLRELGLDPGPELAALEQAILQQDPALVTHVVLPPASESCPYPGLPAYDVRDADTFFGRESDVFAALRRLHDEQVLAVVGPSGCGKSSLARAGIAAALEREGKRVVVVTPGPRPQSVLVGPASRASVLVVDQLEEALAPEVDADERARFFEALTNHAGRHLVVTLRADRLGELAAFPDFAHLVERGLYLLGSMGESDLRRAVEGPARNAGLRLEPGLVDLLVREVEGEPGALPLLSHALRQTWERREGQTLTVAGYLASGGIRQAISRTAEEVYRQADDREKAMLRDLVLRLVSRGLEGDATRARVPRRQLAGDQQHADLIEQLVTARLLSTDGDAVQIAHEALVRGWPRLRAWLDEDIDGHRIMRHLAVAAETWDAMGRPESELYRGVRQAQASEWRTRVEPDLNPTERAFLDAAQQLTDREQRATEEKVRYQHRVNRRLTSLLAAAVVLLVAAAAAGSVAVREADRAEAETVAAEARRLGAQGLSQPNLDTSLLLAVEAVRRDDSPDTRESLLAALSRSPALVGIVNSRPLVGLAVSPSGRQVAVTSPDNGLTVYDAATLREVVALPGIEASGVAFSPDGRHLVMTESSWTPGGERRVATAPAVLVDVDSWKVDDRRFWGVPPDAFVDWALAFSEDGGRVAMADSSSSATSWVRVWDVTRRALPIAEFEVEGWVHGLGLGPTRRSIWLSIAGDDRRTTVQLRDLVTARTLAHAGPFLQSGRRPSFEVTDDGRRAASGDDGSVVVLETTVPQRNGRWEITESARLSGHSGDISSLAFSADGGLLASGSDDDTVNVWSVDGGTRIHRLTGHTGTVYGLGFDADAATLFSAGPDRRLLAWDLDGGRRFVHESHLPPVDPTAAFGRVAPSGRAVAYVSGSSPMKLWVQDLDSGRFRPAIETGHPVGAWNLDVAWGGDNRVATFGADGYVRLWDVTTSRRIAERRVAPDGVWTVTFSPSGNELIVGSVEGNLHVLDGRTLADRREPIELEHGRIYVLAPTPDGSSVLAGSGSGVVQRVDLSTGKVTATVDTGWVPYGLAVSPDGERAAVTGSHGEVGLLEAATLGWVRQPVPAHKQDAWTVTFSPNGDQFVSVSPGLVNLWDGTTGDRQGELRLTSVDRDPAVHFIDDHGLILATPDGVLATWDLRSEAWIEAACRIAGRNLDPELEWPEYLPGRPYRKTCPGQALPRHRAADRTRRSRSSRSPPCRRSC